MVVAIRYSIYEPNKRFARTVTGSIRWADLVLAKKTSARSRLHTVMQRIPKVFDLLFLHHFRNAKSGIYPSLHKYIEAPIPQVRTICRSSGLLNSWPPIQGVGARQEKRKAQRKFSMTQPIFALGNAANQVRWTMSFRFRYFVAAGVEAEKVNGWLPEKL